jgi:DNA-binding transcriptional MerR regulator
MQKSPEAYRTISEISKDLGLPTHVLRFWETKFSVIKPVKRNGNRRYYRPKDVEVLQAIKKYLYNDGYTIKGLQKLLRENKGSLTSPSTDSSELKRDANVEDMVKSYVSRLEQLADRIQNANFV